MPKKKLTAPVLSPGAPNAFGLERWKLTVYRYPEGALSGLPRVNSERDGRAVAQGFLNEKSVEDMALIAHVPELINLAFNVAALKLSDSYKMSPAVRLVADKAIRNLRMIAKVQEAALSGKAT